MRTTLTIDDDVLMAAKDLAAYEGKSVGQVISGLARQGLAQRLPKGQPQWNGIPLIPGGATRKPVTLDLVNRLRDELP